MTQKSRKPKKYAVVRASYEGAKISDHVGVPIRGAVSMSSGGPIHDIGFPFHILTKEDIEKELTQIEKRFGMSPDEFHDAWKRDEIHGFQAMKLGCLYELYRDEYE